MPTVSNPQIHKIHDIVSSMGIATCLTRVRFQDGHDQEGSPDWNVGGGRSGFWKKATRELLKEHSKDFCHILKSRTQVSLRRINSPKRNINIDFSGQFKDRAARKVFGWKRLTLISPYPKSFISFRSMISLDFRQFSMFHVLVYESFLSHLQSLPRPALTSPEGLRAGTFRKVRSTFSKDIRIFGVLFADCESVDIRRGWSVSWWPRGLSYLALKLFWYEGDQLAKRKNQEDQPIFLPSGCRILPGRVPLVRYDDEYHVS